MTTTLQSAFVANVEVHAEVLPKAVEEASVGASKEVIKEVVKEVIKEVVKEVIREAVKEVIKEASRGVTVEASRGTLMELNSRATTEVLIEAKAGTDTVALTEANMDRPRSVRNVRENSNQNPAEIGS